MTSLDPDRQTTTWYGVLETSAGRTAVAWDPRLPLAPSGQVYLFNLQRQAVLPYQWQIVRELLHDVSGAEERQVRKDISGPLRQARQGFLRSRGSRLLTPRRASQPGNSTAEDNSVSLEELALEDADFE